MFEIPEPCDVIDTVLEATARRLHALQKGTVVVVFSINSQSLSLGLPFIPLGGKPDYLRAAQHFLRKFRAGELGRITLDRVV